MHSSQPQPALFLCENLPKSPSSFRSSPYCEMPHNKTILLLLKLPLSESCCNISPPCHRSIPSTLIQPTDQPTLSPFACYTSLHSLHRILHFFVLLVHEIFSFLLPPNPYDFATPPPLLGVMSLSTKSFEFSPSSICPIAANIFENPIYHSK